MDAAEMVQLITAAKSSMIRRTPLHVTVEQPGKSVLIGATWPGHELTAMRVTHPLAIHWQPAEQSAVKYTQDTMPGSPCQWVTTAATKQPVFVHTQYTDGREEHWLVLPLPKGMGELPFYKNLPLVVHLNNARLSSFGLTPDALQEFGEYPPEYVTLALQVIFGLQHAGKFNPGDIQNLYLAAKTQPRTAVKAMNTYIGKAADTAEPHYLTFIAKEIVRHHIAGPPPTINEWTRACTDLPKVISMGVEMPRTCLVTAADSAAQVTIWQYVYPSAIPRPTKDLTVVPDTFEPSCSITYAEVSNERPNLFIVEIAQSRKHGVLFVPNKKPEPGKLERRDYAILQRSRLYALRLNAEHYKGLLRLIDHTSAYTCYVLARYMAEKLHPNELAQTVAALQGLSKAQLIQVFPQYKDLLEPAPDGDIAKIPLVVAYCTQPPSVAPDNSGVKNVRAWAKSRVGSNWIAQVVRPNKQYIAGYVTAKTAPETILVWTFDATEPVAVAPTYVPDSQEPECLEMWIPVGDKPTLCAVPGRRVLFEPTDQANIELHNDRLAAWQDAARLQALVPDVRKREHIVRCTENTRSYVSFKLASYLLAVTHDVQRATERLHEDDLSYLQLPPAQLAIVQRNAARILAAGLAVDHENEALRNFLRKQ